ncbi:MAG: hypothetical protein M3Z19_17835 [Chloroflexota bacterium]|nr:hypothetical protein [Chloroflexota bacterium]
MYRHLRRIPLPLAVFCALIALVGCGGAATPIAPTAPVAAPTAVPVSANTTPIFALFPTATTANVPAAAKNTVPPLGLTDPAKWYNTAPLTLEALRGKPVFLVFWSDI